LPASPSYSPRPPTPASWRPGQSGNPNGRPVGSRSKTVAALDKIGDDAATDILRVLIAKAQEGDIGAIGLILSRVWPARKQNPLRLSMPAVTSPADLPAAMSALVAGLAGGEITSDEALAVANILELQRRSIETAELEQRIQAIESSVARSQAPHRMGTRQVYAPRLG
jgi:hypothetical protein